MIKFKHIHIVHWLILLLSVVITFTAWYYNRLLSSQKLEIKFNRHAEQVVKLVTERMGLYESALHGGVAHIDAKKLKITHENWLAYANSLNIDVIYPGIHGIGVIYNVKHSELEGYLQEQRQQRPNYKIHPQHSESEYWPITYIEPSNSNRAAIGLDMAFEQNRYLAILKARDTGQAQITGPIILVQDSKKTPGFLFYAPFYDNGTKPDNKLLRRQSIVGVTYAPFIMKNLMQGTLHETNRNVSIQIRDGNNVLFDDKTELNSSGVDIDPLFTKNINVSMYGRIWRFDIESNLSFRSESNRNQSIFILIFGLIIDALLLGLFLFISNAQAQAAQMTKVLENKTRELERSNADLEQFSYVASHDLKSPLNGIKQLVGFIAEDCTDILPASSKEHFRLLSSRTDRMIKLLDDLLDYSRLNNSKEFIKERFNLRAMSEDIFRLLYQQKSFSVSSANVDLNLPKVPFEIVLRNLISNAIKHHDKEQGNININYSFQKQFHLITIEDNGPGIPPEYHQHVMEMFKTLKPRDKVEGSGMGLAVIKRIMDHYHGSIRIDSDGKRGTKITIKWPV